MKSRITILMKTVGLVVLVLWLLFAMGEGALYAAEPIKIGAVISQTGRGGFLGTPEKEAITVAVEEVNRQGGIFGRPIALYIEDDQSNPTNSNVAATKLIRDEKVSCLIGPSLVAGSMAVIPICEREEVPHIPFPPLVIPLKKWIFTVNVTEQDISRVILKLTVNKLGARKLALLHSMDTYGMNGAQGIVDNVDKYGASLVITENFDPGDTSMIPQLTKVKAAHPEAIILYANANPASVVAKNYQQLGMETQVIGAAGIAIPDFIKLAGRIVEGGRWIVFGSKDLYAEQLPPDDPYRKNLYDPLRKALKEKYGRTEWNGLCRSGYDAIRIAIEALKIAKADNRAAIRDALEKVEYQGLLGDYKYSPTDHVGKSREEPFLPIIIKDGKFWPYKK